MSNEDRSRRVWRLLERGWTSARALRDAIEQVRDRVGEKVDEARVRLSDEVVSRIAGQPVKTQFDPESDDPVRNAGGSPGDVAGARSSPRPTPAQQDELAAAADAVSEDQVVAEASKSAPVSAPEPIVVPGRSASPGADAGSGATAGGGANGGPGAPTPPGGGDGDGRHDGPRAMSRDVGSEPPVDAGEIVVLARDAEWLFAYWELDQRRLATIGDVGTDRQFLLRVLQPSGSGLVHQSSAAVPSGRRYVRVPFADASYIGELWVRGSDGAVLVARSLPAATPPLMPRPPRFDMVSSEPHQSVLNAAWDLTQVPRIKPEDRPKIPLTSPVASSSAGAPTTAGTVIVESHEEGSEVRLSQRRVGEVSAPEEVPPSIWGPDVGLEDMGSEHRLGPTGEGSEARFGGPGSESRFQRPGAGSETRLTPKADS